MKQKLLAILLVLCMVVALMPAIAVTSTAANTSAGAVTDGTLPEDAEVLTGTASSFSGGVGSANDPYQISDVTEFRYFQSLLLGDDKADYLDKSYVLTGNIYLNKNFTDHLDADGMPVADYRGTGLNRYDRAMKNQQVSVLPGDFTGTFDGGNFGLYNMFARFSAAGGLFENIKGKGTVRNLNLYGGYMRQGGTGSLGTIASSLSGGTIENCYSSVYISTGMATTSGVGGLVGITNTAATIENSTYAGVVNATSTSATTGQVGGIVARAASGTLFVSGCANRGKIVSKAGASRVGGIVAFFNGTTLTIENCINYGTVTTASASAEGSGGIVGLLNAGTLTATQCANYGAISDEGKNNVGGITGYAKTSATYGKCANYAAITATTAKAGGITGDSRSGVFTNCANYGNITGGQIAGIAGGYVSVSTPYSGLYSDGAIAHADGATGDMSILMAQCNAETTIVSNSVGVGTLNLFGQAYSNKPKSETNTKTYAKRVNIAEAVGILNKDLDPVVWVAGETAPELKWIADMNAPEVTIDGASLTIGNSVTLNMFVYKKTLEAAGVSSLQSIHIRDSASENYQGKLVDDKYVFQIKGLTAEDFGTARSYTVQYVTNDNMVVVSKAVKEYSPLQYAINMYGKRTDMETLDPLLLAIVNYAEAAGATGAKKAFNDKHADADWTKLPAYEAVLAGDTNVAQYTYKTLQTEKGLPALNTTYLNNELLLHVDLYGCDYTKVSVKIGNVDAGDITGFPSVAFYPTDLYNTIEFTFAKDAGEEVVATWSIMQYLDSYKNSSRKDFAKATAIYLYAVRAFCIVNHN